MINIAFAPKEQQHRETASLKECDVTPTSQLRSRMAAALVASLTASLALASAHAAFVPSTTLLSSSQTYSSLRAGSATRLFLPATSLFFGKPVLSPMFGQVLVLRERCRNRNHSSSVSVYASSPIR